MSVYVGAELRRLVAERAGHRCEYCLIREEDTYFGCEVDHVARHRQQASSNLLAFAFPTLLNFVAWVWR
jgi:hypothetical protein